MLDALGDELHAVPDHENPRRHRHPLARVDDDAVAAREQRLHQVAVDGDHAEVVRPGSQLVTDHVLGKEPDVLHLLEALVDGAGTCRRAHIRTPVGELENVALDTSLAGREPQCSARTWIP